MAKTEQKILHQNQAANAVGSTLNIEGAETLVVQAIGSFTGVLTFQVSMDGMNWANLEMVNSNDSTDLTTSTTDTAGAWTATVKGYKFLQVPLTSFAGGSVTVIAGTYKVE